MENFKKFNKNNNFLKFDENDRSDQNLQASSSYIKAIVTIERKWKQ